MFQRRLYQSIKVRAEARETGHYGTRGTLNARALNLVRASRTSAVASYTHASGKGRNCSIP